MDPRSTITRILSRPDRSRDVAEELLPVIYDELRRTASGLLRRESQGHTFQTTDLVHEAYLRLFDQEKLEWRDRKHFFGCAAMAMRRILVDHARRKLAGKRIPQDKITPLELAPEPAAAPSTEIIALDQALTRLAELDTRQAEVVGLRYFAGLTETQIADVLEVSRMTVSRDWKLARIWLSREMAAC